MGKHYGRGSWTSIGNRAVATKRRQVHTTWHYPGFGTDSVKTAGWSLGRCFQQLRAWRNMHVGSGAYREVAYNLYALPTGDVVDGRGNRQNGANGKTTANRAGFSVQVLVGDNEKLSAGHAEAMLLALVILEKWHPGITQRQYKHSHWVSTRCPGPYVGAAIPLKPGATPSKPSKPAPEPSKAPSFPLPRESGRLFYYGPPEGPMASVSGRGRNSVVPADVVVGSNGRWMSKGLKLWQERMLARGWNGIGVADGRYGAKTKRAVRQFQKAKGLGIDGKIGPATWSAAWSEPVV